MAAGDVWVKQRNAAHIFLSSEMLEQLTTTVLPRHLDLLFHDIDHAAERGSAIDISQVIIRYIFAGFGDIAWDVSSGTSDVDVE